MRVIGLLCFYNESPTWLAACVTSMHRFCDHVIALDGAYRLYPEGRASSGAPSHDAIVKSCEAVGLGLTLYIPPRVYQDNEVEKRNVAFRMGEAIATPEEDWFFILDADEVIVHHAPTVLEDLSQTPLDVAGLSMIERVDWHANEAVETIGRAGFSASKSLAHSRRFYRAIPGLRAVGNHYTFVADRDGQTMTLRGLEQLPHEPVLTLDIEIEHRHAMRDLERDHAKKVYYRLRDSTGAETEPDEILAEIASGA